MKICERKYGKKSNARCEADPDDCGIDEGPNGTSRCIFCELLGSSARGEPTLSFPTRSGPEEGRVPDRGSHCPATAPAVHGSICRVGGRAVRRVGGERGPGQGKIVTALADVPEGHFTGFESRIALDGSSED